MRLIQDLIPHRDPFLFVDELVSVDETLIVGKKHFEKEDFFKGHFPEYAIVPGVIIVEAMAQCGGAGVRQLGLIADEQMFFLATIDKVKFRKPSHPNDTLRFEVHNIKIGARMIKQSGKAYIEKKGMDDVLAVEAEWMCLVGAPKNSQTNT